MFAVGGCTSCRSRPGPLKGGVRHRPARPHNGMCRMRLATIGPGRADVQLCRAAAVGRGGAVSRHGGNACLCPAVARRAPRQWLTVPKLSGFCLLMKRAVYDAIGGLDERFGIGFFDDDDLAERRAGPGLSWPWRMTCSSTTSAAGRLLAMGSMPRSCWMRTPDGSRTSGAGGVPRGQRVVLEPWSGSKPSHTKTGNGISRKAAKLAKKTSNAVSAEHGCAPVERRALTMIVRDEENNLPPCLESVRGLFDEIVVVDTGSTGSDQGNRPGVRGARCSISSGSTTSPRPGTKPWRVPPAITPSGSMPMTCSTRPSGRSLQALLGGLGAKERGRLRRALRLRPGARRHRRRDGRRPHPAVSPPRGCSLDLPRPRADLAGPAAGQGPGPLDRYHRAAHGLCRSRPCRARKLDRDTKILQRELEDRPDDPFVLFNLGAIAVERKEWTGALGFLERSLAGSAPTDSIMRKLFALIARVHQMMGDSQQALRTCAEGLKLDPEDAELWFRKAVVHRHRGESTEAEGCWRPDPELEASRPVLQRRSGDLRAPDAAQPGGAGRRARRSCRGREVVGRSARRMPRRPRGAGEAGAAQTCPGGAVSLA